MEAAIRTRHRVWLTAFVCAVAALLLTSQAARAGVNNQCPTIADKPGAVGHADYPGIQHLTYCYGPITISPGQNTINLRPANDGINKLWPQQDGYITRF